MSRDSPKAHARAIEDCRQRGGRMLSLVDLVERGSVDLAMAGYLAAVMRSGASLLVGALPGGAGKTAVMGSLLNFIPDSATIRVVDDPRALDPVAGHPGHTCFLAHEIGAGAYYAYIWGATARRFFALAADGHCTVSNLHADTLEQLHSQLCGDNQIPAEHVVAVQLKLFLRVRRGHDGQLDRWVHEVHESHAGATRRIWLAEAPGSVQRCNTSELVTSIQEQAQSAVIRDLAERGLRRIQDVRTAIVGEAP